MILGYARVSTKDQNLDGQRDALAVAGVERTFADTITGAARSRPELDRMLKELRNGDVVVVTKYDRLARSLKDLLDIVDQIQAEGAGFRSLGEDIDTTSPAGRLVFHVFASIAQFERERIVERTKEGLEAARKRGRVGGRPGKPAIEGDRPDALQQALEGHLRTLEQPPDICRGGGSVEMQCVKGFDVVDGILMIRNIEQILEAADFGVEPDTQTTQGSVETGCTPSGSDEVGKNN